MRMTEILIWLLIGVSVGGFGGFWIGSNMKPQEQHITQNTTQNTTQNVYQTTEVFQGQITVVISDKHGITNFNINISGITNISYRSNFTTNLLTNFVLTN